MPTPKEIQQKINAEKSAKRVESKRAKQAFPDIDKVQYTGPHEKKMFTKQMAEKQRVADSTQFAKDIAESDARVKNYKKQELARKDSINAANTTQGPFTKIKKLVK